VKQSKWVGFWIATPALPSDGTTDMTTSHLTNSAKDAEQVIGYSQSTGETTSHPTKQPQNGCQVVGYKPASWQVAGYRNDEGFCIAASAWPLPRYARG
jgi:hypothetical protein